MAEAQKVSNITTLKDVALYYTRVMTPMLTKDAADRGIKVDPEDPNADCEYVVKAVVTEEKYKKMKKKWRGCTNFKNVKEYTIEEFQEVYHKDDENMPDFGEAEEVVLIKFAQKSKVNGRDAKKPKLFGIKGKIQDRHGLEVKQDTLLGNGTKAHLQVRMVDFKDNGIYLYPLAICVTDLVEYASAGQEVEYDDFGIEELDEVDEDDYDEEMISGSEDESTNEEW